MTKAIRWTPEALAAHQSKIKSTTAKEKMQALGRLKTGAMNKTETAYCAELERQKHIGYVAWYKFEGLKFRLADNTFFTVDFAVMTSEGLMEMHEVKGFMLDDANVKIKVAASIYPFVFKVIRKAKNGAWDITEI